jgi:hypothetical protein
MALILGTNCGFVSAAPDADPDETSIGAIDNYKSAIRHTSPAGSNKITEIGVYSNSGANQAGELDVGLYSNDAVDDDPNVRLSSDLTGSFSANLTGWAKTTGLALEIPAAATLYWIAVGVPNINPAFNTDYKTSGARISYVTPYASPLPDDWGAATEQSYLLAIYAKYEAAAGGLSIPVALANFRRRK